jgi:hypothetical protein
MKSETMVNQRGIPQSAARSIRLMPRKSAFRLGIEACHPIFITEFHPSSSCSIFSTPVGNESKSCGPFPEAPINKVADVSRTETNIYNAELNQLRRGAAYESFVSPPPRRFKIPNSSLSIRPKTLTKESWILNEAQEVPYGAFPLLPNSENAPDTHPTTLDNRRRYSFTTPKVECSTNEIFRQRPFPQQQEGSFVLMELCNRENSRILLPDDF